jgi:protein TonB
MVRSLFKFWLIISVGTVLVAFEWKAYEEKPLPDITKKNTMWEMM